MAEAHGGRLFGSAFGHFGGNIAPAIEYSGYDNSVRRVIGPKYDGYSAPKPNCPNASLDILPEAAPMGSV